MFPALLTHIYLQLHSLWRRHTPPFPMVPVTHLDLALWTTASSDISLRFLSFPPGDATRPFSLTASPPAAAHSIMSGEDIAAPYCVDSGLYCWRTVCSRTWEKER